MSTKDENNNFDRTMIEIGYVGAFYGMSNQARIIFDFYRKKEGNIQAQTAGLIGEVLLLIGWGDFQNAAQLLEKFLEQNSDAPNEIKVFLVLVYKKAKIRADRVQALLKGMEGTLSGATAEAAHELAMS